MLNRWTSGCGLWDGIFTTIPVYFVTLLTLCTFGLVKRKLDKYNIDNTDRFFKAFLGSLIIVIIGFIPILILIVIGQSQSLSYALTIPLIFFMVPLLVLVALIEGVIFSAVDKINEGEKFQFKPALSEALISLKPLFFYNLVLQIPGLLTGISSIISQQAGIPAFISRSIGYSGMYLDIIIAITLLMLPLQIVITQNSFGKALILNFILIWKNLFQYTVIIAIGFIFLSIPALLDSILTSTVAEASYLQPVGMALIEIVRLYIAVIFYLTLFRFIKETKQCCGHKDIIRTECVQNIE